MKSRPAGTIADFRLPTQWLVLLLPKSHSIMSRVSSLLQLRLFSLGQHQPQRSKQPRAWSPALRLRYIRRLRLAQQISRALALFSVFFAWEVHFCYERSSGISVGVSFCCTLLIHVTTKGQMVRWSDPGEGVYIWIPDRIRGEWQLTPEENITVDDRHRMEYS